MMESTANYRTQPLSVYAPASVGNMSVGFDALGLALAPIDGTLLGDIVELQSVDGDDWTLEVSGPFAHALPDDPEQNIVLACCRRFQQEAESVDTQVFPLQVRLNKRLPVGSGPSTASKLTISIGLSARSSRPSIRCDVRSNQ